MNDNERNEEGSTVKVKRSRGIRGAQEIAKACKQALQSHATGRFSDLDEEMTQPFVFDRCAISRNDKEFFQMNSDSRLVLERAQARARELSSDPWTPLIHVETELSTEIEAERIVAIEKAVSRATELSKVMMQKKGWNVEGEVLNHDNFTGSLEALRCVGPKAQIKPRKGQSSDIALNRQDLWSSKSDSKKVAARERAKTCIEAILSSPAAASSSPSSTSSLLLLPPPPPPPFPPPPPLPPTPPSSSSSFFFLFLLLLLLLLLFLLLLLQLLLHHHRHHCRCRRRQRH
jgi:hypothetical protein